MRHEPSATERVMWTLLRHRKLEGLKFRRQVPLGRYIADFVCLRHRLIVELDGPFHKAEYDAARDAWLTSQGFRVMRFKNEEVERRPELVVGRIAAAVEAPVGGEF